MWGEGSYLQVRKRALLSSGSKIAHALILNFPGSRTVRNTLLLVKPLNLWYFVMAARADSYTWVQSSRLLASHWVQRMGHTGSGVITGRLQASTTLTFLSGNSPGNHPSWIQVTTPSPCHLDGVQGWWGQTPSLVVSLKPIYTFVNCPFIQIFLLLHVSVLHFSYQNPDRN